MATWLSSRPECPLKQSHLNFPSVQHSMSSKITSCHMSSPYFKHNEMSWFTGSEFVLLSLLPGNSRKILQTLLFPFQPLGLHTCYAVLGFFSSSCLQRLSTRLCSHELTICPRTTSQPRLCTASASPLICIFTVNSHSLTSEGQK